MTYVTCSLCGVKGTKQTMLQSKHTGRSYCLDTARCTHRQIASKLPEKAA